MATAKHYFSAPAAIVVAIAFLFPFAFAQSSEAIGSSAVAAHLEYSVLVPDAAAEVVFSTYAFANFSAQSAAFNASDSYFLSTDDYGNSVLSFQYKPVQGKAKKITMDASVTASYDPSRYDFEPVVSGVDYLSQSKLVILDSQASSLAKSITVNASSSEEVLAALSSWVYGNIVYDSNYTDSALDSSATLAAGRGSCDEKAHLLEALLRSKKIPARHAVGFAYSGTDWEPHAWVEAAINGKWVPVDPTFDEMFFIDATHLRLAVGRDQEDTKYSLKATGTSDLSGTKVEASSNFSFSSQSAYSGFFSLSASFPAGARNASQTDRINATVRNLLSRTIAVPVSLLLHPDFSSPSAREQILIVPAGSKASASWVVVYPYKVAGGYSYNYSSTVSAYGAEQTGYLLASQSGKSEAQASVAVENIAARKLPEALQLYFWLRNTGSAPFSDATLELAVSDSKVSKTVSYLAVGNSTRVEFLVPYSLVSNPDLLEANLSIRIGATESHNQINIDLSEGQNAMPSGSQVQNELASVLSSPVFAAAALAVVLSALVFAFTRRHRRK